LFHCFLNIKIQIIILVTLKNIMDISQYIKDIDRVTFCDTKEQQKYISLAHFVSLQPRECMKVKDDYSPDGMIINRRLYFWLPTPPKKQGAETYITDARNKLKELVQQPFDEIIIDVRNNIGGILSIVIDAMLPIICDNIDNTDNRGSTEKSNEYLFGVDNKGKRMASFTLTNNEHIINVEGSTIREVLHPVEPELVGKFNKPISVICNRYTMSTGEIVCIIVRLMGGVVYGERTRGLTNGMTIISTNKTKSVAIPTYTICDGKHVYKNGVEPDKPLSAVLSRLRPTNAI